MKKSTEISQMQEAIRESCQMDVAIDPMLRPKKKRIKWTIEETNDLLHGCNTYGVGNWKKILYDARYHFNNRSPIDLKDRFRTIFPEDYRYFYPNAHTHINRQQKVASQSFLPRVKRKERCLFTPDEDAHLLEGFMRYGPSWSKIRKDLDFCLSSRRSIDLRDRFRNAFPEKYAAAGFKSRPPKGSRKVTRSAPIDESTLLAMSLSAYNHDSTPVESKTLQLHNNIGNLCNLQSMIFTEDSHTTSNISLKSFHGICPQNIFNSYEPSDHLYVSSELLDHKPQPHMKFIEPQNPDTIWSGTTNHNILALDFNTTAVTSDLRYSSRVDTKIK